MGNCRREAGRSWRNPGPKGAVALRTGKAKVQVEMEVDG